MPVNEKSAQAATHLSLKGLNFTCINLHLVDHIFSITLNRPAKRNAINSVMVNELIYALDYAKQERDIRVLVLAANGPVFCAGGDLKAMGNPAEASTSNVPKRGEFDDLALRLYHLDKPSIARIQGSVFAGALALVSSVTHAIAVEDATFSAPEIHRGLWPFQVMASLFRVMTPRNGLDFIMRGKPVSAAQAATYGLINQSLPADTLNQAVDELARELASLAPAAMSLGLQAFRQQSSMTMDEALPYLKQQFQLCLDSEEAKEGIAAFFEKRPPVWK